MVQLRKHLFKALLPLSVFFFSACSNNNYITQTYHNFDSNPNDWHSYDYSGVEGGGYNHFLLLNWADMGGVDPKTGQTDKSKNGYATAHHSFWRIDTPETPDSILALINYHLWDSKQTEKLGVKPLKDWRNAQVSFYLRGDDLNLKGAKVYFWLMGGTRCGGESRYHLTGFPLKVENGTWGKKQTLRLTPDESLWHKSYPLTKPETMKVLNVNKESDLPEYHYKKCDGNIEDTLRYTGSYGFSFVGFPPNDEVTGSLSLDEFKVEVPN